MDEGGVRDRRVPDHDVARELRRDEQDAVVDPEDIARAYVPGEPTQGLREEQQHGGAIRERVDAERADDGERGEGRQHRALMHEEQDHVAACDRGPGTKMPQVPTVAELDQEESRGE